jgi:pimeloyl-ACP methyl ester carboxylesterase
MTDLDLTFDHAGATLYAALRGRGPAVVFLHGGLADHRASLHRVGELAATHWLIAPDVRGAGRSHHAGDLGFALLADDLAALLDRLGLAAAVVGGASFGAAIALAFALRHPRRCRALLQLAPAFAGEELGQTPAQRAAMARMDAYGRRAAAGGIAELFPLYAELPPELRARARAMAAGFDPASVTATTRFLASGAQPFARLAELAALSMPALVVPGTDPEHPAEFAARLAGAIPRARLLAADVAVADLARALAA